MASPNESVTQIGYDYFSVSRKYLNESRSCSDRH